MSAKIQLTDSVEDVMVKMSEGNPGALHVCIEMLRDGEHIDPDNAMGGLGTILSLDTLGFYGPKIWMLYNDVCECDLPKMLALIRGWQLGFLSKAQLHHAVENYGTGINIPDICAKVVVQLPRFKIKL